MEGAQLPWKVQKIDSSRGPVADYSSLSKPLPKPPNGMQWDQDADTREWRLVAVEDMLPSKQGLTSESGVLVVSGGEASIKANHLEHLVLPTDTLEGICIRYRVTPTQLRQANHFSGSNLLLAPSKLIIPMKGVDFNKLGHATSNDGKTRALMIALPQLGRCDAQMYLKLSEWDLESALRDAKADMEWEASQEESDALAVHEAIPLLNTP